MKDVSESFDIRKAAPGMVYYSGKNYVHSIGLSSCFRQWRAQSHCRFLHGYSLQVEFRFESNELDERNWICDFGSLKSLRGWLENMFDHKTLVAEDDPALDMFRDMQEAGLINLRIVPATGCEAFARFIYEYAESWLISNGYSPRVKLSGVYVKEHGANEAGYGVSTDNAFSGA